MNREIYALQLIDEETGEVLKDVTPITESISVIHDGEKLSEVIDFQRDKIQEQSKSNLVLVTTMQKLLSEKIEKLETEKAIIENNPVKNLIKGQRTHTYVRDHTKVDVSGEILTATYIGPESADHGNFSFDRAKADLLEATFTKGDKIYCTFKCYSKPNNVLLWVRGVDGYSPPTKITTFDGYYLATWEKEFASDVDMLESAFQFHKKDGLIISTRHMVTFEEPVGMIDNLTRSGVQEELDFYKSQLEKLKLTQEVDLNLLLTL